MKPRKVREFDRNDGYEARCRANENSVLLHGRRSRYSCGADLQPAVVLVIPPPTEHHGVFRGAGSYAAIRFDLDEVSAISVARPGSEIPATGAKSTTIVPIRPSEC